MFALGVTLLMLATGRNPLRDVKAEEMSAEYQFAIVRLGSIKGRNIP